jgi:hypothetical protein
MSTKDKNRPLLCIWVSGKMYLCTHKSVLQKVILPPSGGTKTALQVAFFKLSQLQFLFKTLILRRGKKEGRTN